MRTARRLILLLSGAVACGGGGRSDGTPSASPPVAPPAAPPVAPPLDTAGFVLAETGDAPLVLVAPHGGDLLPATIPDRRCADCVTVNDANTIELAREIVTAFQRRTGRRPHLVLNRLHRRKFDGNRDLPEATGGFGPLEPAWRGLHAAIDSAKVRALRVHPRALLLDLHGHAHAVARLELGYVISGPELRLADSALAARLPASSIARLGADARSGDRGAALVRGPRALGTLLAAAGIPAVPSAQDPAPLTTQEYFSGGYNTDRHGSRAGGAVDAIQIEHHMPGIRDSAANRAAYADRLAAALVSLLRDHYGWTP